MTRCHHIDDFHLHEIAPAQLAVDHHVEQSKITMVLGQFKSNADYPDMFKLQRSLLADNTPSVPNGPKCANGW